MTQFHLLHWRLRTASATATAAAREGCITQALLSEVATAKEEYEAYVRNQCLGMEG